MNSSTPAAPSAEAVLAWVRAFAEGWRAPASAEAFADHFEPWFDPHIRLIQPQTADPGWPPGLPGTLRPATVRAHPRPGRAGGTLRDRRRLRLHRADATRHPRRGPIAWRVCDRATLREGLVVERESYFDPTPLLRAILTPPGPGRHLPAHGSDPDVTEPHNG